MSYDLQVFSQQSLTIDVLRKLIAEAGLAVDESAEVGEALTIVRGARNKYSFTLGIPVRVEPEDVPEEVTAVLLSPSFLSELIVEGSSTTETSHAVRFARRLAEASSGVVVDQQTGQTWARGKLRAAAPVQPGHIHVVQLTWYTGPDGPQDAGMAWLELARRHLPEALPRRFGSFEPLSMKLDVEGPDAFVQAVADESMSVYFKAKHPCLEGGLAGGAVSAGVRAHSLLVHREPLSEHGWREPLQRLFVEFALSTGAFFASAEVQRGVGWSGRSVWYDSHAERCAFLAGKQGWSGLLPYPAWWTWFGSQYVPLVVNHLPPERVKAVGNGLFHWRAEEPQDRDQLTAAGDASPGATKPRRALFRHCNAPSATHAVSWLPQDLLATVDITDPHLYNPPLIPAKTVPPSLS